MINKDRLKVLFQLAWPITAGMIAANVLTVVDTYMVGQLGPVAMAAMGMGAMAIGILFSMVIGLHGAVQAIVSRRVGEQNTDHACDPLHAGLILSLVLGTPLSLLGFLLSDFFFGLMPMDDVVREAGIPYFKALVLVIPGISANVSFRGFFNGIGNTKIYMYILTLMVIINIFFNWVLIYGNLGAPELGILGAGIASCCAIYCGTLGYAFTAFRHARPFGWLHSLPTKPVFLSLTQLAIPATIQQALAGASGMIFFSIVSAVGTAELAATNIIYRISMFAILPAMGFGIAGATLVGQALGRGQADDARNWGWDTMKVCCVIIFVMALPMIIWPKTIIMAFVGDEQTAILAAVPLIIGAVALAVNGGGTVIVQALNGAGDQKWVMYLSLIAQWIIKLPLVWLVAIVFKWGLTAIWIAQSITFVIITIASILRWRGDAWTLRKI